MNWQALFTKPKLINTHTVYIPKHFLQEDKIQIVNFMKQYSFATIGSLQNNSPVATHLPCVVSFRDNDIYWFLTLHGQINNGKNWKSKIR